MRCRPLIVAHIVTFCLLANLCWSVDLAQAEDGFAVSTCASSSVASRAGFEPHRETFWPVADRARTRPDTGPGKLFDTSQPEAPSACPDPANIRRPLAKADQIALPILMYHHVREVAKDAGPTLRMLTVAPEAFEAQMAYLAQNRYHTIYFSDLIAYFDRGARLPEQPIIITFDDGWLEQYEVAYPILRQHCLVGTFFPPTNWVDHSKITLTWAQVEEMSRGGMEFGSHTVNHYLLSNQTAEQVTRQLKDSKEILEGHVRLPVVALAYPGGAYNAAVASLVPKTGYGAAVGVANGAVHRAEDRYQLHRITVTYGDTVTTFAAKLAAVPETLSIANLAAHERAARFLQYKMDGGQER